MADATLLPSADWPTSGTDPVTMAALSFLAQYTSRSTRSAYRLDLQLYFQRAHVQAFAIYLAEQRHNAPASVGRRLGTVSGFYELAVLDDHIEVSPRRTSAGRRSTTTRPRGRG